MSGTEAVDTVDLGTNVNWGNKRASPRIQSYLLTPRVLELS